MLVEVSLARIGEKIRSDIAVGGDYNELIGRFYVVHVVAVLFFCLVESVGISGDCRRCFLVLGGGGESHILAVLLVMLIEQFLASEFQCYSLRLGLFKFG